MMVAKNIKMANKNICRKHNLSLQLQKARHTRKVVQESQSWRESRIVFFKMRVDVKLIRILDSMLIYETPSGYANAEHTGSKIMKAAEL